MTSGRPAKAPRHRPLILLAAGLLSAATTIARTAEPTLYEKLAASHLVIHGRCSAVNRRATIEVLEVFKGNWNPPTLQVAFRSDNVNRAPGTTKIVFEPGMDAILVLEPELDSRERPAGGDRFQLTGGIRGKIELPPEGADALLAAARRLSAIQRLTDQEEVWEAQKGLLSETNPWLVRVGFEEILKFRLGDEALVMPLLAHLDGPRPEFRREAARVIGQMFERQQRTGSELPSSDLLVRETLARARGDEAAEVRVEAVHSLRLLDRPELAGTFREIAAKDPSQLVRYEAQVALKDLAGKAQ